MSAILEVKSISKKFKIRHEGLPYVNLRDTLSSIFKSKITHQEFWALRNVEFDVQPGEAVGIIGKNGAGKSTLLKILSRITPPTSGSIKCRGRIASLLEIGTGFHPELTGKENIFMNGSLLGMKKSEIKFKFSEIVEFSGVENFLDTPLKHYSSGMQLRLAFAVAAFLEPEILIIDEVLAVGDHEFQKKCINKMEDVSHSGRTILFVSHNIGIVSALCTKGIMLKEGMVHAQGPIGDVIHEYLQVPVDTGNKEGVKVSLTYDDPSKLWIRDTYINIFVEWPEKRFPRFCFVDLAFYTYEGTKIFALESSKMISPQQYKAGVNSIVFRIKNPGFAEKEYRVDIGLKNFADGRYDILIENVIGITSSGKNQYLYKTNDSLIVPLATCEIIN